MSKLGELKEILKKLIAIPSVTGNEHDIAIYIADYLRQCGVDSVELQPVEGRRKSSKLCPSRTLRISKEKRLDRLSFSRGIWILWHQEKDGEQTLLKQLNAMEGFTDAVRRI